MEPEKEIYQTPLLLDVEEITSGELEDDICVTGGGVAKLVDAP